MTSSARLLAASLVVCFAFPAAAPAQIPRYTPPPRLIPPPAPVVPIRVVGPTGSKVTFYPEPYRAQAFASPANAAVRPGYVYRFKIDDLPQGKDVAIFPTIEVIGTLHMPPPCCFANFPVPIAISADDVDRVLSGAMITKMIAIENPDRATPVATQTNQPIEITVRADRSLIEEAFEVGRPMIVVRFGQIQFTPEEMAEKAIQGTMILPGDGGLGAPCAPPCVPWQCLQMTDPKVGPRYPEEECMHDGGDVGRPVGFDADGKLQGLDPTDTVAEYGDSKGNRRIAISNRVCLCVPRYVVVRTEIRPGGTENELIPSMTRVLHQQVVLNTKVPPRVTEQIHQPEIVQQRQRPELMRGSEGPVILEGLLGTGLVIGSIESKVVVGTSRKECPLPEQPLVICKTVSPPCAEIGDLVTFTLKYGNPGAMPINDVVVSDSLTGRLEYVQGSQKSDRETVFSIQENEAGSGILRWEFAGKLLPGQTGTITFQAKIR